MNENLNFSTVNLDKNSQIFGEWSFSISSKKIIIDKECSGIIFTKENILSISDIKKLIQKHNFYKIIKLINYNRKLKKNKFQIEILIQSKKLNKNIIIFGQIEYLKNKNYKIKGILQENNEMFEKQTQINNLKYENEKLFKISYSSMIVLNKNGVIQKANPQVCKALGYKESELDNTSFFNLLHFDDSKKINSKFESLKKGLPILNFKCRLKTYNNRYNYYELRADIAPESDQIFCSLVDLNFRIEEKKNLVQTIKMVTLGEMASGIAHEVNNPLTILLGRAQQVQNNLSSKSFDPELISKNIQIILRMTERIAKIVRGLKNFSRNSTEDTYTVSSIKSILDETLDLCSEKIKISGIKLDISIENNFYCTVKPSEISQVLLNLINNSIDAISHLPEKWIKIEISKASNDLQIIIKDSGTGIPDEISNKMMHPFFTTKGIGKGTGLGLSISKGIIEQHKGELLYLRNQKNTCFLILIPLYLESKVEQKKQLAC